MKKVLVEGSETETVNFRKLLISRSTFLPTRLLIYYVLVFSIPQL